MGRDLSAHSNKIAVLETEVPMMKSDIKEIKDLTAENSKQISNISGEVLKVVSTFRGVVMSSTAIMGILVILLGATWKAITHFS